MIALPAGVLPGLRRFDRAPGTPFVCDFRPFSLLRLGAVLVPHGVTIARAARGVVAGEASSHARSRRATITVLAIGAALIPLQFLGSVLTARSLLGLAALAVAGPRAAARTGRLHARPAVALPHAATARAAAA